MKIKSANSIQDLEEMSRLGYVGEYEVYVNTNDSGKIPHFHLRKADDWNEFHTCICILEPKYFHHGNKQDVLNSKQRKELQAFMESKPKYAHEENNWYRLVVLWNENNSDVEIPDSVVQPDYRNLR